jgi:hypothetical protein
MTEIPGSWSEISSYFRRGKKGSRGCFRFVTAPAGLPSRSATLDPETCSVPTSSRTERRTSVPPARRRWRCFATARLSRPLMQASAAACAIERHVGITQLRLACSKPVNSQSSNNTGFALALNYNGLRQVGTRFIRSPVGPTLTSDLEGEKTCSWSMRSRNSSGVPGAILRRTKRTRLEGPLSSRQRWESAVAW